MSQPTERVKQTVSRNPATGEVLGCTPVTPETDLRPLVERARIAQKQWAGVPIQERTERMRRVRDHLAVNAEAIADLICKENGKTRVDALATEVMPALMAVDYYRRHARKFLKPCRPAPGNILLAYKRSKVMRVPYGVIAVISPWNYPFAIPFSEVVIGLLAGNAVILKTATATQLIGRALASCFEGADLPSGVFSYVNLPGAVAGSAFLQAGVDKLFFTGSVAAGKHLMAAAAETLTPLVLELGGNDAMLVCEDADLHRGAAGALWAGFSNCGQSCAGVERIYVHERVYAQFLEILKAKVEFLRVGCGERFDVDMGVMTTEKQIEKVRAHLEDALAKGAVVYARSQEPAGVQNGLPALVLTEVTHEMRMMQEETFGPLVGVMRVENMDQAVALANDTQLGLTASIWSRNAKRAEQLAGRIKAGVVTINDHMISHGLAETPWGGFKQSGIGRTHARIGFDEMTQVQVIVHDRLPFAKKNIWWYPSGKEVFDGLLGGLQLLYARSFAIRLRGLWRFIRIVPRCFGRD
jgi:acyl-CoA reductase-like NAD-dependent aldehyde dehydrogenase